MISEMGGEMRDETETELSVWDGGQEGGKRWRGRGPMERKKSAPLPIGL